MKCDIHPAPLQEFLKALSNRESIDPRRVISPAGIDTLGQQSRISLHASQALQY